ncbi:hypothetical protein [Candidatus Ichthyocystis sparus]|uniref:hypothetical protein n=1 Tax=Candidatus Ichthyocystis sparus TaxID=1561004 RepID=UPI00159EE430|nr:hypothetical protein [Candidatus Ichthyocystis sparus]
MVVLSTTASKSTENRINHFACGLFLGELEAVRVPLMMYVIVSSIPHSTYN